MALPGLDVTLDGEGAANGLGASFTGHGWHKTERSQGMIASRGPESRGTGVGTARPVRAWMDD